MPGSDGGQIEKAKIIERDRIESASVGTLYINGLSLSRAKALDWFYHISAVSVSLPVSEQ